jgi:hypothetical protein
MADIINASKLQSKNEIRQWDFDFSNDLQSGVTISSVLSITHIPPSGSATTPVAGAVAGGIVPVLLGPLAVTGQHVLICEVNLSNTEISSLKLIISVEY